MSIDFEVVFFDSEGIKKYTYDQNNTVETVFVLDTNKIKTDVPSASVKKVFTIEIDGSVFQVHETVWAFGVLNVSPMFIVEKYTCGQFVKRISFVYTKNKFNGQKHSTFQIRDGVLIIQTHDTAFAIQLIKVNGYSGEQTFQSFKKDVEVLSDKESLQNTFMSLMTYGSGKNSCSAKGDVNVAITEKNNWRSLLIGDDGVEWILFNNLFDQTLALSYDEELKCVVVHVFTGEILRALIYRSDKLIKFIRDFLGYNDFIYMFESE